MCFSIILLFHVVCVWGESVCASNNDTRREKLHAHILKKTETLLPLRANTRARAQHANEINENLLLNNKKKKKENCRM